jgi:site-specific DNA-methyltransferase (adenine-specific)
MSNILNTITTGDALEILPTLAPHSVDLIITDPPYFLPVQSYVGTREGGYESRSLADTSILRGFFTNVFKELARVLKPIGTYYIFCDGQSYPIFYNVMFPYCKYVRPLIWDKIISYNGYTWRHQHEFIAWGELDASPRVPTGDGDVLQCRGVLQKNRFHPAEKPIELLEKLIAKHEDARVILDPFCGSASTCIAARRMDREYIGIELDEKFYQIARERLATVQPLLMPERPRQLELVS